MDAFFLKLKKIIVTTLSIYPIIANTCIAMDQTDLEDSFIVLSTECQKGTSWLPDNISLSDVLFVGAHNSPFSKERGWTYAQQQGTLTKQWDSGVRAFKLPLRYYQRYKRADYGLFCNVPEGEPTLVLSHEMFKESNSITSRFQKMTLKNPTDSAHDYFRELKGLLDTNPQEVCIMILETHNMVPSTSTQTEGYNHNKMITDLRDLLTQTEISDYACKLNFVPQQKWPTLGQLRGTGKRLVILSTALHLDMELTNPSTIYCESNYKEYAVNNAELRIEHNKGKGQGDETFCLLNNFVESSCWSYDFYKKINSYGHLINRVNLFETTYGNLGFKPNILLLDYAEIGEAAHVAQDVNLRRLNQQN